MDENVNKKLDELQDKITKYEFIGLVGFLYFVISIFLVICYGFPAVNNFASINNIEGILSVIIKLGLFVPTGISLIVSDRLMNKVNELYGDRANIDIGIEQQEIMDDIIDKYGKLNDLQKEKIVKYITCYDSELEELYDEIDMLFGENIDELKKLLKKQVVNNEVNFDNQIECVNLANINEVDNIINEINSWCNELSEDIMISVLIDIKRNKELLEIYFPDVKWDSQMLDLVYDGLFNNVEIKNTDIKIIDELSYAKVRKKQL